MMEEKVLYTDGHDVTVTDSTLQVRNHEYRLNGVTKCGMMVLQPRRAPGIILLVVGLGLIIAGMLNAISPSVIPDVEIAERMVSANMLALWIGAAIALIGVFVLGVTKQRYAVRIATAEGEKDALVSDKREYVHQIVDAINHAVTYVRTRTTSRSFSVGGTT